jgi:hypothetical protein
MVIHTHTHIYNGGGKDIALLHPCAPTTPTTTSHDRGAQAGHAIAPRWEASPRTVMTAFSSGNGIASLSSGPSLGSVPQVRDPEVMKLHIMGQSLSLCLTG